VRSSIRPNRTEVSRNFPVLGFTIRTSRIPAWFEVALATDPELFRAGAVERRTPASFYSTASQPPIAAAMGESVWLVPDDILSRLTGGPLIYFALATFSSAARADPEVWIPEPAAASSVAVSDSYRQIRRPSLVGARGPTVDFGAGEPLTWAGDTAAPGIETIDRANGAGAPNGATNGADMNAQQSGPTMVGGQAFTYDDGLGMDFWSSPQAAALSGQSFDVRCNDVPLIPQPTNMSCWAAAAAMVVAWRERLSHVSPAEVAAGAREWAAYTNGLFPDRHDDLARAWGLTAEAPVCYAVDGFRRLLEAYGPLWVGVAVPSGHAVVATGVWGDGTPEGTWVRYHDPWPVAVGQADGVKRYDAFMQEYEDRATVDASGNVNVQILHAGGRRKELLTPMSAGFDTTMTTDPDSIGIEEAVPAELDATTAEAMAIRRAVGRAVPLDAAPPDYPQATRFEPAGAGHFTPRSSRTIDRIVIHITDGGPNISGTIRWFQLPQNHPHFKPVSSHYIVGQDGEVVQMVRHHDIAHHAKGANSMSIGIEHVANTSGLAYTEAQYCSSATLVRWLADTLGIPCDRSHILGHREATTTSKTCPGPFDWDYFMSMVVRQQCFSRDALSAEDVGRWAAPATAQGMVRGQAGPLLVGVASEIAGAVMERVLDNEGDISWELDQLKGFKYPGDDPANAGSGPWRDGPTITSGRFTTGGLVDEITATFEIRWQYNGRSVGNIQVINVGTNDAVGWGLKVKSTINNDAIVYQRPGTEPFAAVKVTTTYHFSRSIGGDKIGVRDLMLYGDGTWRETSRWTQ
jgi:N-acetylmuramoyl-L-alanine amidase/Papain-like cysteine protease AvrRpt2